MKHEINLRTISTQIHRVSFITPDNANELDNEW